MVRTQVTRGRAPTLFSLLPHLLTTTTLFNLTSKMKDGLFHRLTDAELLKLLETFLFYFCLWIVQITSNFEKQTGKSRSKGNHLFLGPTTLHTAALKATHQAVLLHRSFAPSSSHAIIPNSQVTCESLNCLAFKLYPDFRCLVSCELLRWYGVQHFIQSQLFFYHRA